MKKESIIAAVAIASFSVSAHAAWQTGLKTVTLTGTSSINTTSYASSTTNIVLSPVQAGPARASWGGNTTYAYWGQICLDGSTYNFAESIDDACWLKIDGTVVLNNGVSSVTAVGSISREAGWYNFEVRFQNGGGGAGPVNSDSWGTTSYGFGYNTSGYSGKVGSNYTFPVDPGDRTLFRYDDGTGFDDIVEIRGYPFNVPVSGVTYGEVRGLANGEMRTFSVTAQTTNYADGARATCAGWKLYKLNIETDAATLWLEDTSNVCEYEHPGGLTRLVWHWELQDQISTYGAPGSTVEWADRKYWTGGGDGIIWHDPANWSPAGVPTLTNSAYIETGTAYIPSNAVAARIVVAENCGIYLGSTGTVTEAIGAFPTAATNRCLGLTVAEHVSCAGKMALGGRWRIERDVVITNLTVDIGGDLVLSGAAVCAVYANTMTNAVTWTNLYHAAAAVNVAGDLKVLGTSVLYPTADRLTGNPVKFSCLNFKLDSGAAVNAQNRGWGWITYTLSSQIDPRRYTYGTFEGTSRFTLAPNSLSIADWRGGAGYACTYKYAPFAPGTQSAAYSTPSDGGGQFWLWAAGTATVDGIIRADGYHNAYSGNSGGGIWLAMDTLVAGEAAQLISTGGHNTHDIGNGGKGGRISISIGLSDAELERLAMGETPEQIGLPYADEINEIAHTVQGGLNGYKDVNGISTYAASGTATAVFGAEADLPVTVRSATDEMGAPQPGYGAAAYAQQSEQAFTCEGYGYDPTDPASIRYSCVGYVVSNSTDEVTRGETDQFTITIGNRPLYVYWIWGDREIKIPVLVPEHAKVKANGTEFTESGALWLSSETVPVLETTPDAGYEFLCWEGEITYGNAKSNPLTFPAGTARRVKPVVREIQAATARAWKGGTKEWAVASNWEPAGLPGIRDAITVASGVCLVSNYFECASLSLSGSAAFRVANTASSLLEESMLVVNGDLKMTNTASLVVAPNNRYRHGRLHVAGNLTLDDANTLTVSAGPTNDTLFTYANGSGFVKVGGNFAIRGTSTVIPNSEKYTGGTVVFNVDGNLLLTTNASFKAVGNGFGRVAGAVPVTLGPGWGYSYTKGGGYGGFGVGYDATYGRTYGFPFAPIHPGSPAGSYTDSPGGGLIRIHVGKSATIAGTLDARPKAKDSDASSASGGGIWVTAGRRLLIEPGAVLTARGGKRCTGVGAPGGGGRVALGRGLSPAMVDELSRTGGIMAWKDVTRRDISAVFLDTHPDTVKVDSGEDNGGVYKGTFRFLDGRNNGACLIVR